MIPVHEWGMSNVPLWNAAHLRTYLTIQSLDRMQYQVSIDRHLVLAFAAVDFVVRWFTGSDISSAKIA